MLYCRPGTVGLILGLILNRDAKGLEMDRAETNRREGKELEGKSVQKEEDIKQQKVNVRLIWSALILLGKETKNRGKAETKSISP